MTELLLAISAFVVAHMIPALKPVRGALIRWLGKRVYLFFYIVLTLAILAWIAVAEWLC